MTFAFSHRPGSSTPFSFYPKHQEEVDPSLPSKESPCHNKHSCASPQCFLGGAIWWHCFRCPQLLSKKTSQSREIPVSPLSPCGTVYFGCQARKPGLFLPIILILSWGVIGIELSVWKFLLRTQGIEESLEAELWEDSCQRPLGRDGSDFLEWWRGQQVDISIGRDFLLFQNREA